MAVAARELSQASRTPPDLKWSLAIAEITDCADCLTAAAQEAICSTGVYHSELFNTEVTQVLKALHEALCAAEECKKNESMALKAMTNLQSAANQLLYAISTTTSATT
ncbi:hypothetical protein OESDEN_20300 [Oesophagostomum dentatum]|uniref:Uncharacterized protein n=1 Tax=Oesophagostomum dentatum TaxID=61180 RepID=A0A0B1S9Y9_OESDE|nr:hypothetical protein OESDEN_20300 [Oesophagostomum dentatum]